MANIKFRVKQLKVVENIFWNFFVKRNKTEKTDEILLFVHGGRGDALLYAPAIATLTNHYAAKGIPVYCICSPQVKMILQYIYVVENLIFLQEISVNPTADEIEEIYLLCGTRKFKRVIAMLSRATITWVTLISGIQANQRLALATNYKDTRINALFFKLFSRRLEIKRNFLWANNQIFSLDQIKAAIGEEKASNFKLRERDIKSRSDRPYITISIDWENPVRRWQQDKMIQLIRFILENYSYDIYLSGNRMPETVLRQYQENFKDNKRVIFIVGKLSTEEWIELIRNSALFIGADGGGIHIAAAVGTQSICLAGVWDKGQFLPYQSREDLPEIVTPICVFCKDLDRLACAGCVASGRYGHGNKKCREKCKADEPCLCLQKIQVEDVVSAMEKARQDGKIS